MTLLEIIQKATEAATAGIETSAYPALDPEWLAEAHLEMVFATLARRYAAEGRANLLARKQKVLAFTNGAATLTTDVLQSCLEHSTLRDTADASKLYSYVPEWDDFIATYDHRLGYYNVPSQGTMRVIEPDDEYEQGAGLTGSRTLTALCVWAVPAGLDDTVDVSLEVAADLIAALSEVIKARVVEAAPVAA